MRQWLRDIRQRGALRAQLDTYRHAFETTAADRDRLLRELRHDPPPQTDDDEGLGRYWQKPTDIHRDIIAAKAHDGGDGPALFRRLIDTGFVLQHALVRNRAHIGRLIDWQITHLRDEGLDVRALPPEIAELNILPAHTLFETEGRIVGTDFLRFLEYLHVVERHGLVPAGATIVEIGAGYGGLARLLKLRHAPATIYLLDIYETLAGAELYLRHAWPQSRIAYFDPSAPQAAAGAEFILCRLEDADALTGLTFDLAINTWSFGEMPNRHIDRWFSFLTEANATTAVFFTNHFMMPICLESPTARAQLRSARWLPKIDGRWDILEFAIHPGVHGCGYWRHFQQGARVVARLFPNQQERRRAAERAERLAHDTYLEDWAQFSVAVETPAADQSARRAALLARPDVRIDDGTVIDMTQAEQVLGIVKDDIRNGMDGAFFRLWNHWRLTGAPASLRLLRVLLYLKWRPALKNPQTGIPYTVISGEDYQFGTLDGGFSDDSGLIVPPWLSSKLSAIFRQ